MGTEKPKVEAPKQMDQESSVAPIIMLTSSLSDLLKTNIIKVFQQCSCDLRNNMRHPLYPLKCIAIAEHNAPPNTALKASNPQR